MRILCVHQGYELYGSDRCFIDSVGALRASWPNARIDVLLPREGPIAAPLRRLATSVIIEPILVLRRRHFPRLLALGAFRLLPALYRAIRRSQHADLIYVNTIVVLDYLLAARLNPAKTLIHVHEIPDPAALKVFRLLLMWSRAELIFNSNATRASFGIPPSQSQHVLYNGIDGPAPRQVAYDGSRPLRLLMIGRVSRIKGQDLLVEALASLPKPMAQKFSVRIIGDSFEQDIARERMLRERVRAADLEHVVKFEPFDDSPAKYYEWADIVVVPSRKPESLGRVAIEAMAYGCPPLVAAQGGLLEVIEDGVSGWCVPPNDHIALAGKLSQIALEPRVWRSFSGAARARYEGCFDSKAIASQLQSIVRSCLTRSNGDHGRAEAVGI